MSIIPSSLSNGSISRINDTHYAIDRINDTHYAIADIAQDRVYVLNIETGVIEWGWIVQHDFSTEEGGPFPKDWTHVNDVEMLPDGRMMVSLRNQDQVVFLDRQSGYQPNWTLGCEDCHDILYGQHNPDYIDRSQGGPAVVVSDSESNRVVEFQREDGSWRQTWTWQDEQLDWPRDADRLPNGHTLITDSRGDRVIEVDSNGEIVWTVDIGLPYEAERLGTGPESTDGPSAQRANLKSRTVSEETTTSPSVGRVSYGFKNTIKSLFPRAVVNAVAFGVPGWIGFYELLSILSIMGSIFLWAVIEIYWSPYRVSFQRPISLTRKGNQ